MEFDNDIFISYAHLDNEPLIKDAEGWVSQFHHAMEVRVDQLLGKKLSVWRDPKLHGNDYLDDTIFGQLPKVALLVSIFTPRYVKSAYCTNELTQFCEASENSGGLRVENKTRIFKVLKTPVPIEEHPELIRDCIGYEFYMIDPVSGRARELNHLFGDDTERAFWIKLDDLAQDICELLKSLERDPAVVSPGAMSEEKATVFLADSTFDVREHYDGVKRDLLAHQFQVVPDRPLPMNVDELMPLISESLSQSQLSIHIIGKSYGIVPEGTDRSIIELQNELAIRREEEGGFSRIIWIPPGLEVEDDRQKRLIGSLRSDPRIQKGADLLETPFEDLKMQIHKALKPAPVANIGAQEPNEAIEIQRIYVLCDVRDFNNVTPVADYLFEQGCEVMLPVFQGDEADVRSDNDENLRSADAVLIYYGSPNESWLRAKLRELRKSAGLGRTAPLKAKAILVAPPNSQQDNWLRTHEARVIAQPEEFTADLLEPFLADLRN